MKGLFWPLLLIAAALGTAAIWRYTSVFSGSDDALSEAAPAPVAIAPVRAPVATEKPVAPVREPVAEKKAPASSKAKGDAKSVRAVPRTKDNPTGSPWLEPAAKLLREYRRESAELERNKDRMDMAAQRAKMKKLHFMRERLEKLNARHRAWKAEHPAP